MWKIFPLMVCIQTDGQTDYAIFDAERNDVSVQGLNALKASWNIDGFVIEIIIIPLKLTKRMN
jgi:hypothetical protein